MQNGNKQKNPMFKQRKNKNMWEVVEKKGKDGKTAEVVKKK